MESTTDELNADRHRHRSARDQHDPHARHGRRPESELGHPGTPMALAPLAYTLYTRVMRHNPADASWANRDRFVLSCGHASMLLYSILYLCGYGLELDDIERFRQLGSPCAGHPEYRAAPGIEATTGPLGQGIAMCVGTGARRAHARRPLQPARPRHHRPPHLHDRLRWRHGGGDPGSEGRLACRTPRPRPPDRLLRRQPHLDRRRHGAGLQRGRRCALRGLRLACCAAPRCRTRTSQSIASSRRRWRRRRSRTVHR